MVYVVWNDNKSESVNFAEMFLYVLLTVPGGQEFHFPHFSSNFDKIFVFFLKLYLFSSSFWPSGWTSRPPGKALVTPLILKHDWKVNLKDYGYRKDLNKIEKSISVLYRDWIFKPISIIIYVLHSIFKTIFFSILLGSFPNHNLLHWLFNRLF